MTVISTPKRKPEKAAREAARLEIVGLMAEGEYQRAYELAVKSGNQDLADKIVNKPGVVAGVQ